MKIAPILRKELHLQSTNIGMGCTLVAFEFLLMIMAFDSSRVMGAIRLQMGDLVQYLQFGVITPMFLVLLPILMGAVMMGRERQWGVLDWNLSLPISQHRLWWIKALVALGLTLGFGIAYTALDGLLMRILESHGGGSIFRDDGKFFGALKINDLYPATLMPLVLGLGAVAGTMFRSGYVLLIGITPLAALLFLPERIVDPMWMLVPKVLFYPKYYLRHEIHYARFALAALALLLWAGVYFRFELPRWREVLAVYAVWIVAINALAFAALKWEFHESEWVRPFESKTPGVEALIGSTDKYIGSIYRIPDSEKLMVNLATRDQLDRTAKGLSFYQSGGEIAPMTLVEVNVPTGDVFQHENLWGQVAWIDPKGVYFSVGDPWSFNAHAFLGRSWAWPAYPRWIGKFMGLFLETAPPKRAQYVPPEALLSRSAISRQTYDYFRSVPYVWKDAGYNGATKEYDISLITGSQDHMTARLIERDVMTYTGDVRDYCVSRDVKWYSRWPERYREISIYNTDHTTTYTLTAEDGEVRVAPQRWGIVPSSTDVDEAFLLGPLHRVLSVSPDGNWLAFTKATQAKQIDVHGNGSKVYTYTRVECGVLDLRDGTEKILSTTGDDIRDLAWDTSHLMTAWSDKGELACLMGRQLTLAQMNSTPDGSPMIRNFELPDPPTPRHLFHGFIQSPFRRIAFWDDDTLLLWGEERLWRFDINEAREAKTAKVE